MKMLYITFSVNDKNKIPSCRSDSNVVSVDLNYFHEQIEKIGPWNKRV